MELKNVLRNLVLSNFRTFIFVTLLLLLQHNGPVDGLSLISSKLKTSLSNMASSKRIVSNIQTAASSGFDPLSPEGSWFLFNQNDANQKKKNRRKKCRHCDTIPIPKEGPTGPQGPRGYPGPPGPSGGTLSLNDIEEYIKSYLKDLVSPNKTLITDALNGRTYSTAKAAIPVTFSALLTSTEVVPLRKAVVIKGLTIIFGSGQFKRGVAVMDGKFYVTKSGIYQISAAISFKVNQTNPKIDGRNYLRDRGGSSKELSMFLCVDLCSADRRLKWSGSVTPGHTTATLSGHVSLRRGQAIMLYFSNPSSFPVELMPDSTFSAALIGT